MISRGAEVFGWEGLASPSVGRAVTAGQGTLTSATLDVPGAGVTDRPHASAGGVVRVAGGLVILPKVRSDCRSRCLSLGWCTANMEWSETVPPFDEVPPCVVRFF